MEGSSSHHHDTNNLDAVDRRVAMMAGHFLSETGDVDSTNPATAASGAVGHPPRALARQPTAAQQRSADTGGGFTVAVLGAAGGIGQPLSLLMKQCPLVETLRLYDIANVAGVAADLSHVNTRARVQGYTGPEQLGAALSGRGALLFTSCHSCYIWRHNTTCFYSLRFFFPDSFTKRVCVAVVPPSTARPSPRQSNDEIKPSRGTALREPTMNESYFHTCT